MSASSTHTIAPRAAIMPALLEAGCPQLGRSCTQRNSGVVARSSARMRGVESLLPSSTASTSKERPQFLPTFTARSTASLAMSSSLYMGMTKLRSTLSAASVGCSSSFRLMSSLRSLWSWSFLTD